MKHLALISTRQPVKAQSTQIELKDVILGILLGVPPQLIALFRKDDGNEDT